MVLETLSFSPLNQLTRLVARGYFIIHSRRGSYKSYSIKIIHSLYQLVVMIIIHNIYALYIYILYNKARLAGEITGLQ
jgi:hypothetical protein